MYLLLDLFKSHFGLDRDHPLLVVQGTVLVNDLEGNLLLEHFCALDP